MAAAGAGGTVKKTGRCKFCRSRAKGGNSKQVKSGTKYKSAVPDS